MPNLKYTIADGDAPFSVACERLPARDGEHFRVVCGSTTAEIEAIQPTPGCGWFVHHGRVVRFHAVRTQTGAEVWVDGRRVRLTEVKQRARRAGAEQAGGPVDQLAAPMPGTVLKINVGVGETFAAHQPLVVMESMKMEMTLSSPHAGKVKEIRCRVGELVAMGAVLAKLEAS